MEWMPFRIPSDREGFGTVKGSRLFVVPGTGLVNDAFGLSGWGPYGLLKWSLVARLRRCRVVFLSVGAGPIDCAIGRCLVRVALSFAHYRSYRDLPSKAAVDGVGVRVARDPIYPDLVFGLSPSPAEVSPRKPKSRRVVALGLMEYVEKYSEAGPMRETYARYLESLADFARWLLQQDYDVWLLLDDDDTAVIADFKDALQGHVGRYEQSRVVYESARSVQEVLSEINTADVVVATRFHNILMSLLLEKPVIAISFHHKCSSLMHEMGLSEYCHDIGDIDGAVLIAQFEALTQSAPDVTRAIAQRIEETRKALNRQYELVFEPVAQRTRFRASALAT
jgi:polysaccharide pyruvyl transferase WcaK-like protein